MIMLDIFYSNMVFPIYDASIGVAYMDYFQNGSTSMSCCGPQDGFVAAFNNLNTVGIKELDKNQTYGSISVYPNPSNGVFTIQIEGLVSDKIITFNVYNTMGQMVYREQYKTHNVFINKELNLSALSQGVYFINILQGEKSVTVKVIKQ